MNRLCDRSRTFSWVMAQQLSALTLLPVMGSRKGASKALGVHSRRLG